MADIRIIQFERDADTKAQTVFDIVEFDVPTTPTPANWTALTRDPARRDLLLSLVRQIDQLAAGKVDEISLVLA